MIPLLLWLAVQDDVERLRSDSPETREEAMQALVKAGDVERVWPLLFDEDPEVRDRAQRIVAECGAYGRVIDAIFGEPGRDRDAAGQIFHRMHAPNLAAAWRDAVDDVLRDPYPSKPIRDLVRLFPLVLAAPGVDLDQQAALSDTYVPLGRALDESCAALGYRWSVEEGAVLFSRGEEGRYEPPCVKLLRRLAAAEPWGDRESAACVADICDDGFARAFEANVDSAHAFWRHAREILVCRMAKANAGSAAMGRIAFDEMHRGPWDRRGLAATALWNAAASDEWARAYESRDPVVKFCAAYYARSEVKATYAPTFGRLFEADELETLRHTLWAAFRLMPPDEMPFARMLWIGAIEPRSEAEFRKITHPRLSRALVDLLDLGASAERVYALSILDLHKDEATVEHVGRLALGERQEGVQAAYVHVLDAYLPQKPAIAALEDFFVRAPAETADRAMESLSNKSPTVLELYARLSKHESSVVRRRVVSGLRVKAHRDVAARPQVLKLLEIMARDADRGVAEAAAEVAEEVRHLADAIYGGRSGGRRILVSRG